MFEIRSLTAEEEHARQDALRLSARLVGRSAPLTIDHVQALYDVILAKHSEFDEGVIALGVAFGELLVARAGYQWIRVTDDWGSENALSPIGWDVSCHPITMIQKRIERREAIRVCDLIDDTIYTVQKQIAEGRAGPRTSEP